jgi:hypothetical protein
MEDFHLLKDKECYRGEGRGLLVRGGFGQLLAFGFMVTGRQSIMQRGYIIAIAN